MSEAEYLQFVSESSNEVEAAKRALEVAAALESEGDATRAGIWLQRAMDIVSNGGFIVPVN